MEWTTSAAQHCARAGQLEVWIHAYLATGEWANPGLSASLRRQQRWWRGPLEVALADLERVCGPEAHMEYCQDAMTWEQAIERLQRGLRDPVQVPPLIVEYRRGVLSVRDGNHRHEAMRRSGWRTCWVVMWYNTEAEFLQDHYRGQEQWR